MKCLIVWLLLQVPSSCSVLLSSCPLERPGHVGSLYRLRDLSLSCYEPEEVCYGDSATSLGHSFFDLNFNLVLHCGTGPVFRRDESVSRNVGQRLTR
ncbi:hypothetical protein QBC46DRAFT_374226 [Diplogelasinospora grovesii]|uniref:Secreted protein n=1 Tax=Diplogelasinospora grovesii TaxID=303347 RepID=A0AAN6NJC8_9PEZI|nr:hypothetical protein QBC46DRAFT_374226 [Diplogelasinospora grovesii]